MKDTEKLVASCLLDIEAVKLSPDKPFTWASGWLSPIYCDNRVILSSPKTRNIVCDALCELIKENYPDVEVIAGVATGAIAIGMLVADRLNLPFVYVRPKPKDHGTGSQIEGRFEEGARVVIIEDLVSTGGSSMGVLECVRRAKGRILGMAAIFSYNFDVARKNFENANCELHTLSNYDALISVALERNFVSQSDLETLKRWRLTPSIWK